MKLVRTRFFVYAILFLAPTLALAAGLVPCGITVPTGTYDSAYYLAATSCNFCDMAQLIQNIVNFLIMVSIPISVAMFAWAGILMFTNAGNPKKIARAKKIFSSVVIGFIIAVSGWLIVQVILQTLTNSAFYNAASWTALSCTANRPRDEKIQNVLSGITVSTQPGNPNDPNNPTNPGGSGGGLTQQQAIDAIASACQSGGYASSCITQNSQGNCSDQTNGTCTSLAGVQVATLQQVTDLQSRCGCTITITGGTEVGHGGTSDNVHTQGNAIDMAMTNALTNTILSTPGLSAPTTITIPGEGPAQMYTAPNGVQYINEGNHWHVQLRR